MALFHLVLTSLVAVSLAVYSSKSKKGYCPSTFNLGICSDCSSDYDCTGSKKCCHANSGPCSSYCVLPVSGSVRSSRRGSTVSEGIGPDTVEVITRKVVTSEDGGVLRSGVVGGIGNINDGGIRRVVKAIDVGGVSGIAGHGGGVVGIIGDRGGRRLIKTVDVEGVSGIARNGGAVLRNGVVGTIGDGGLRRVIKTVDVGGVSGNAGHGGGVLHSGVVGAIGDGRLRRVIKTIDVGGVSGIGRVGGHGGVLGKRVSHISGGGVEELFDDGDGLHNAVGGTGRTVIETVRVTGRSGAVGPVVRRNGGLSDTVVIKTVGGGGRLRGVGVVDTISSRKDGY